MWRFQALKGLCKLSKPKLMLNDQMVMFTCGRGEGGLGLCQDSSAAERPPKETPRASALLARKPSASHLLQPGTMH